MALGGFSGSDSILSVDALKTLVREGKVRYFSAPSTTAGGESVSGNAAIFSWVSSHCTAVPASEYGGTGTSVTSDIQGLSGTVNGTIRPSLPGTALSSGTGGAMAGPQNARNTLYDCAGAS